MLSIKPRQRASEKRVMFKFVKSRFSEFHCERLFQKVWVDLQSQKRCVSVSGEPVKKEQEAVSFLPILRRKSFVTTFLCRNLNLKTFNFVSVVHRKGSWQVVSQFVHLKKYLQDATFFGFSLVRKSFFWPKSDKSFCRLSRKRTGCQRLVQLTLFFVTRK